MFSFYEFLNLLAELLSMFGVLIFGVAASWFALYAFRNRPWQLQIAVFLGFFLFVGIVFWVMSSSSVGAFALGSGGALLFWGLREQEKTKEEAEPKEA